MSIEVIAEIGVNHNGKIDFAKRLIEASKSAGADTVKFQLFEPSRLTSSSAGLASYQVRNGIKSKNQAEMLERLKLSLESYGKLKSFSESVGLNFLVTPFDLGSLEFLLTELGLQRVKISSGDLSNPVLLFAAAKRGLELLVSTGMAELQEVSRAVSFIKAGFSVHAGLLEEGFTPSSRNLTLASERIALLQKEALTLTLMHCVSSYPAPATDLNISSIAELKKFQTHIGYSDHAKSSIGAIMALALGSVVFEKHITLDKELDGPDHAASLTPMEFKDYVASLKEAAISLGDGRKRPMPSELDARLVARRGIFASRTISSGEPFSESNLELLRPEGRIASQDYFDLIGAVSTRDYSQGDSIE